jgi:hypothetical protein
VQSNQVPRAMDMARPLRAAIAPFGAADAQDDLVASTRVTDYARHRMANSARSRAEAVS